MNTSYQFTEEQLNKINKLKNPNLTQIIKLGKELELDPKILLPYLIEKELRESEKK